MAFRWAYINCTASGTTGSGSAGPPNSLQFVTGSEATTTGSAKFTYETASANLFLTGNFSASNVISASAVSASFLFGRNVTVDTGEFVVRGANARAFITGSLSASQVVSASVVSSSFYFGRNLTLEAGELKVHGGHARVFFTSSVSASNVVSASVMSASEFHFGAGYLSQSVVSASTYYGDGATLSGVHAWGYNSFTTHFSVSNDYDLMGVNVNGGIITASLYLASAYHPGQRLTFKDIAGSSSTNNIVISSSAFDYIDSSSADLKVQTDFGSVTLVSDGVSAFFIVGTN